MLTMVILSLAPRENVHGLLLWGSARRTQVLPEGCHHLLGQLGDVAENVGVQLALPCEPVQQGLPVPPQLVALTSKISRESADSCKAMPCHTAAALGRLSCH